MKNINLSFSGFMKKVPNTIENTGLRTKNNIIQCHTVIFYCEESAAKGKTNIPITITHKQINVSLIMMSHTDMVYVLTLALLL